MRVLKLLRKSLLIYKITKSEMHLVTKLIPSAMCFVETFTDDFISLLFDVYLKQVGTSDNMCKKNGWDISAYHNKLAKNYPITFTNIYNCSVRTSNMF